MTDTAHRFDDSAAYERFMGRWSRAAGAVFVDWLAAPARARWLDVGCGTGVFTELIAERCSPAEMIAVDPQRAQIDHARRQAISRRVDFRVADAQALPFSQGAFDLVVSALAINFIPDRARALGEMRRVVRPRGLVAGYVWDFPADLSPSWPLRLGLRDMGVDVPQVPGTHESSRAALASLFETAGFEESVTRTIDATASYADFEDFWGAQTPSYSPTTKIIAAMTKRERARLKETVHARVPGRAGGKIEYSARANAIKAYAPA